MPTKPTAPRRRLRTCPGADLGGPGRVQHHHPFWLLASLVAGFLCMDDLSGADDNQTGYGFGHDLYNVEGNLNRGLR